VIRISKPIGRALTILGAALCGVYLNSLYRGAEDIRLSPAPAVEKFAETTGPSRQENSAPVRLAASGNLQLRVIEPAQGKPAQDVQAQPLKPKPLPLKEPADTVLEKLAKEAGIDSTRYSSEQKREFAALLVNGQYGELAQRAGVDLRSFGPEQLNRFQQIVTGGAPGNDAGTEPHAAAEPPAQTNLPLDPYQKLRDERGVDYLYGVNSPSPE